MKITEELLLSADPETASGFKSRFELFKLEVNGAIKFLPSIHEIREYIKDEINEVANVLNIPICQFILLPIIKGDKNIFDRLFAQAKYISNYLPDINIEGILEDEERLNSKSDDEKKEIFKYLLINVAKEKIPVKMQQIYNTGIYFADNENNTDGFLDENLLKAIIEAFYYDQTHEFLKTTLDSYRFEVNEDIINFFPQTPPANWVSINTKMTNEEIWKFFSFLWKETCGDKDQRTFMTQEEVKDLLKYGLAYPTVPERKFRLNLSPKRKVGVVYHGIFLLFQKNDGAKGLLKRDFARFLCHHFQNFESITKTSVYANLKRFNIRSQNFDFNTYLK